MAVAAMARKPTSPRRKGTGAKDQSSNTTTKRSTINANEESEHEIDDDSVFAIGDEVASSLSESSSLLCVQFPPRDPRTLSEALAEDEENRRATRENKERGEGKGKESSVLDGNNSDDDEVTGFWRRAVPDSAVEDVSSPVLRREPPSDRVRYIMSTRLGALPPTKRILDEYPIPKEILDALERHRHFHVDAFSLETSFDPIRVSNDSTTTDGNTAGSPTAGWECYVRRSVPLERKPVSFVLASLAVARERPVPPPSDIFHQHVLAAASSEAAMLAEVRQLYDHVHDAYREFRSTLHRNLDVSYLVDLAFRSSLNSTSFFLDEDDDGAGNQVVPIEVTVKIPPHLLQRAAAINSSASSSKWRAAKKGATRMNNRRGAIALSVKSEAASVVQRNEMLNKLTTFSAHEVRLMELWHSHDPDNNSSTNSGGTSGSTGRDEALTVPLDPIPMPPALSARFEAVWRELQMPAEERLDLAIKYSSLTGSTRLTDAVTLWELAATLIREREELLRLVRGAASSSRKSSAVIATETAMLQDLTASSVALKEALVLTYVEVGDFVRHVVSS